MFSKSSRIRDKRLRLKFRNTENSERILRYIRTTHLNRRKLPLQHRCRNHCLLTGRTRSVNKDSRVSRITFRELALRGALSGITKSSW